MLRPTRFSARWVLPVTSPPLQDGAVLVDADGRIAAVGPLESVPLPDHAGTHDLGEAVLLPGLVNAHAHLELSMFRGLLDDLEFPDWIATLLRGRRDTPLGPDDFRAAARWSCVEALAGGITTVAATEDSDGALHALRESGQRGLVFREVFGPSPAQASDVMRAFDSLLPALRELETDLVRVGISPHSPYSVSDELFAASARSARAHDLPVAVHAAESADENALVVNGTGVFADRLRARGIATPARARSTIALLGTTGILDCRPLLIHGVHLDAQDIALLAAAGARVVHCPVANARLGHGMAPILELLDAGVTVALGTDSMASNNRMDLLEEARFAQMLMRSRHASASLLPAEQLLRMVTIDGARALGLDDRIGALEAGRDADLCAVRLDRPHTRPVHDPLAALFHAARASDCVLAVVRGRIVQQAGRPTTLDVDRAREDIDEVAARLRRTMRAALANTAVPAERRPA